MTIARPRGLDAGFHADLTGAGAPGLVHAGDQHAPTSWVIYSHTHHVWELYLQLAGPPTRWFVDDRRMDVPSRGLLAVPPGVRHAMAASAPAPYHFYFAALDPAAVLAPGEVPPVWRGRQAFLVEEAGSLVAPFAVLLREVATHQPLRAAGLAHAAALVVVEASRIAGGGRAARPLAVHPAVGRARQLIESRPADGLTVRELAAEAGVSPTHLAELFRAAVGVGPGRYRTLVRLERARQLLAESDLSVAMIAADLGYSSSQHFATVFRRETGATPSEYRVAGQDHPNHPESERSTQVEH